MTYADDVAAARAEVARCTAAKTAADAAAAVAAGNLTEAQAILDYLLAHPPVTPPLGKPVVGASCGSNDGGLPNFLADARRGYDLTGSGSTEAIARCKAGGIVWVSYKGQITATALRADLTTLANRLKPKNLTAFVTYEHEASIKDVIPPDVYHAGWNQLDDIIDEFPTLEPIVCMTGFDGDKDPSLWETYWRPNHKKIGFDHYNKGHQKDGDVLSTPAVNWGPLLAWAQSKGKPVCIGETGVGDDAVAGPVIKTNAQWYAEHRKFVLDPKNNIAVACAFDSGQAILNQAEAKAWYGV